MAPALAQPAPAPAQPIVNALTSNAQLDEISRNATGLGKLAPTDTVMAARLALQAREGGPRGAEAQKQLSELGVTASTGHLLGETNQMAHAKEMQARVDMQALPPGQRKIAEADYNRSLAIHTQLREQAYADDTRKMAYDTMQAKLGNENLRAKEIQGNINLDTQKYSENELMRPVMEAMKAEELKKLRLSNVSESLKIERETELNKLIPSEEPQPTTQLKNQVVVAPTIDKYEQTWEQGLSLAARYNIPEPVRNQLHLGVLASSYDSPVELAKDVKGMKDFPEGVVGVSGSDVADHVSEVRNFIANNVPPDQAVEQMLKDSGKDPTDKGYPQLALNISASVWKEYKAAGDAALAETKTTFIPQAETQQRNQAVTRIAPLIQQTETPEVVQAILASKRKALGQALLRAKTLQRSGTDYAGIGIAKESEAYGKVGMSPLEAESTEPEQIKKDVLTYLLNETKDPQAKAYFADQLNPATRDPALNPFLDALIVPFNKGYKAAKEKEAKEQDKQATIRQEYQDEKKYGRKMFVVFPDPKSSQNPKVFRSEAEAIIWEGLDSKDRAIYEAKEKDEIKRSVLSRLGNETYINATDAVRKSVDQFRAAFETNDVDAMQKMMLYTPQQQQERYETIIKKYFTPIESATPTPAEQPATDLPKLTLEQARDAKSGTKFIGTDGAVHTRK